MSAPVAGVGTRCWGESPRFRPRSPPTRVQTPMPGADMPRNRPGHRCRPRWRVRTASIRAGSSPMVPIAAGGGRGSARHRSDPPASDGARRTARSSHGCPRCCFLLLGMLAGSEGPGGIECDSPTAAQNVGAVALAVILFTGGQPDRHADPGRYPLLILGLITCGLSEPIGANPLLAVYLSGVLIGNRLIARHGGFRPRPGAHAARCGPAADGRRRTSGARSSLER
jgi:hypothetical protein